MAQADGIDGDLHLCAVPYAYMSDSGFLYTAAVENDMDRREMKL